MNKFKLGDKVKFSFRRKPSNDLYEVLFDPRRRARTGDRMPMKKEQEGMIIAVPSHCRNWYKVAIGNGQRSFQVYEEDLQLI